MLSAIFYNLQWSDLDSTCNGHWPFKERHCWPDRLGRQVNFHSGFAVLFNCHGTVSLQRYDQELAKIAIFIYSHALPDLILTKASCKQGSCKDSYLNSCGNWGWMRFHNSLEWYDCTWLRWVMGLIPGTPTTPFHLFLDCSLSGLWLTIYLLFQMKEQYLHPEFKCNHVRF